MATQLEWDLRILRLAKEVAGFSKDPSTRVGAVIVDSKNRFVSMGYNGFARKVKDTSERLNDRDIKLMLTRHAENNAIDFAKRDLTACTIYTWPFPPCASCASQIIQVEIARVVAPPPSPDLLKRWGPSLRLAEEILKEAGIPLDTIELKQR